LKNTKTLNLKLFSTNSFSDRVHYFKSFTRIKIIQKNKRKIEKKRGKQGNSHKTAEIILILSLKPVQINFGETPKNPIQIIVANGVN